MKLGLGKCNHRKEDHTLTLRQGVRLIRNPYLITFIFLSITFASCNPRFIAVKPNGKYYSIFGFLNARADTQYIRIEELRDSMPRSTPANLHVIVKLADLTSSQSVILRDSLVHFAEGPVHNFYTTEKIIPTHTYKLTVTGPAGQESSARITMPSMFPKPEIVEPVDPSKIFICFTESKIYAKIRIRGVSKLVAVNAIYKTVHKLNYIKFPQTITKYWLFKELKDTLHQADGTILGRINYPLDICSTDVSSDYNATVQNLKVVIAAGNNDWPDFVGLNNETEAIPSLNTDIKNGIGYFGGIITDTLTIYGK